LNGHSDATHTQTQRFFWSINPFYHNATQASCNTEVNPEVLAEWLLDQVQTGKLNTALYHS
jgi:hypothetical protein